MTSIFEGTQPPKTRPNKLQPELVQTSDFTALRYIIYNILYILLPWFKLHPKETNLSNKTQKLSVIATYSYIELRWSILDSIVG